MRGGATPAAACGPPRAGLVRAYAFAMVAGVAVVGAVFVLAMR